MDKTRALPPNPSIKEVKELKAIAEKKIFEILVGLCSETNISIQDCDLVRHSIFETGQRMPRHMYSHFHIQMEI